MLKKLLVPLAGVYVAGPGSSRELFGSELGFGLTPGGVGGSGANSLVIPSFHVGWSWYALYLSWDAYAMPDAWTYNYVGTFVPSFLNTFDARAQAGAQSPSSCTRRRAQISCISAVGRRIHGWREHSPGGRREVQMVGDQSAPGRSCSRAGTIWDRHSARHYTAIGQILTEGMAPALNFTLYF